MPAGRQDVASTVLISSSGSAPGDPPCDLARHPTPHPARVIRGWWCDHPGRAEVLASLLVAAVVIGPALRPGYPMRYDLVSGPDPVLGDDALGLGDRLPRAVPWDAAVAVLSRLLPDGLVVQVFAVFALALAGAGAARLARPAGNGRWIALLVAVWNPFVLEQLAIGHVPHLVGYAAVPWVASRAADGCRCGMPAWPGLVLACTLGSLTPGGGLLVVGAAAAGVLSGPWAPRRAAAVLGVAVVVQAPWVTAGLLHPARVSASIETLQAFAVRGETRAGVLVDTLGLGGMWAQSTLPTSRSTVLASAATVLLLGLALIGVGPAVRSAGGVRTRVVFGAAAGAGLGYAIALLPHLPGGGTVLRVLVLQVPGAGLLRDGHRWLAWPAMVLAVLAGHGAQRLGSVGSVGSVGSGRRAGRPGRYAATLILIAGAVVAVAPDLAGGLAGRLDSRVYPSDWETVRAALDRADDHDRLLVLPWQPFRLFAWSGPAPVLDPAPRVLPRRTLVDDSLSVRGVRLPAEGVGSRAVAQALDDAILDAEEARALGVGWVLVERGTPGALPSLPSTARPVVAGRDLTLLRLQTPPHVGVADRRRRLWVTGVHIGVAALLVFSLLANLVLSTLRRISRR